MRTMTRLIVLLGAVALIAIAAGLAIGWQRIHEPYKGYSNSEQFVEVPSGASTREIGRRLIDAGVIRDDLGFRLATWWSGEGRSLQAGEYRFDRPLSPLEVVDTVARGAVYGRRITFPEGLTIPEMARIFESQGFGPAAAFTQAARNESLIADLDPAAADLEGYLFPETYALPRGTAASALVEIMVRRFRDVYTPELRARAEAAGLNTRQLVTLASLVEKETGQGSERPLVAAVYRNRMKIGMGMQADPTVIYALQKAGRYDGNISRDDLQFDSPYNTYRYAGLPPGPIAAPGSAAIAAAAAPADVPYLYFVSRNDGSHVFSTTLDEHNRNVQRFQVEYFRERRQQQGASGG
jgi:UPF0755 protein